MLMRMMQEERKTEETRDKHSPCSGGRNYALARSRKSSLLITGKQAEYMGVNAGRQADLTL